MKQMKVIYLISFLLGASFVTNINAQQNSMSFSLKNAQEYAAKNAYSMQNAKIDLTIAKKKIWETTAMGLPQVSGQITYQDMLDIPTTLLPDFISPSIYGVLMKEGVVDRFGRPISMPSASSSTFPAKFGTQHNASLGGTVSQLIFSGQYIVGLQASKVFYQMSDQGYKKSEIDIRYNVASTYYLVLVLKQNKEILDKSLVTLQKTVFETEQTNKQGFIEDITVDQMKLNLTTLQNAIISIEGQIQTSLKLLKFQMGMDLTQEITLTDALESFVNESLVQSIIATQPELNNLIDYQMMLTQVKLQKLNLRREQSNFLPTIAGFYTYKKSAMRTEFDIFKSGQDWFPTSIIGINIDVPIFSSGSRMMKVQQAKLNLQKMQISQMQVSEALKLEASQATINFNTSVEKFNKEKINKNLASKIYQTTLTKYNQGVASSIELTQAYSQYLTSESNYHMTTMELLNAKLKLDKSMGR
ncbi:MAG: TolC family protein [Bacteroidota bacterium]